VSDKPRKAPPPDHRRVQDFYDGHYYADPRPAGPLPWHMRAIAGRLGDLDGASVVDIACGDGAWLAGLAELGARVSGIDISVRAVNLARQRLPQGDIRQGVAERLPFADGAFDLVTCLGSLEHFVDQPAALREIRRVSRDQGRFLILVPNAGFLTRRLGLYRGTAQASVRETVRSLEEWSSLLDQAGLVIESRWSDLHPLSRSWILRGAPWRWPLRLLQALALAVWPLHWQYQVYFFGRIQREGRG